MKKSPVRGHGSWFSVIKAAEHLGTSADALRKMLERRAVRGTDGGIEAHIDGVRARKFGRTWKVQVSAEWGSPKKEGVEGGDSQGHEA